MFQAVVTSCWATEYAVASVGLAIPLSDATLKAWVTPAPPGVTDVTLAIELPPLIRISVSNVTGIEYAARKTAITPRLATQATNSGKKTRPKYVRGLARMPPPSLASSHQATIRGQMRRASITRRSAPPPKQTTVAQGCVWTNANLMSNDPPTLRKR